MQTQALPPPYEADSSSGAAPANPADFAFHRCGRRNQLLNSATLPTCGRCVGQCNCALPRGQLGPPPTVTVSLLTDPRTCIGRLGLLPQTSTSHTFPNPCAQQKLPRRSLSKLRPSKTQTRLIIFTALFARRKWLSTRSAQAQMDGKPFVVEEFGKYVPRPATSDADIARIRDPWFEDVFGIVEGSVKSGGPIHGALTP